MAGSAWRISVGVGDAVAECVGEVDADDAGGALDEAAGVSVPEAQAQAARVRVTTRAARAAKGAETEERRVRMAATVLARRARP